MIFNGGPSGNASSAAGIDFNFGGKFNLETDIQISFDNETYQNLKFYSNETAAEKEYYELRYQNEENPDAEKWYIKFLNNCYVQLSKKLKCEIFMVGQGQAGTSSKFARGGDIGSGGNGGNGGKIKQYNNEEIAKSKYQILIQQNNVEIKTNQELIYTSDAGEVIGQGGAGASISGGYTGIYEGEDSPKNIPGNLSSPGGDGQKKYNIYYGAGGGGGLAYAHYISGSQNSDGSWPYGHLTRPASQGGGKNGNNDYSGGNGGAYNSSGGAGKLNTGSGGGGGGGGNGEAYSKPGGAGSYGTIIISSL